MRRFRPLLLLAILAILAGTGAVYYSQKARQRSSAPALPKPLPPEASFVAPGWHWSKSGPAGTEVELKAKNLRQVGSPSRVYLEGVELRVFAEDRASFDRFTTDRAEFDTERAALHAAGDVEISTGEPVPGSPRGRQVSIRTSGLTFVTGTGRAETQGAASFRFAQGEGKSVGASYDPGYRELRLHSQAEVVWRGTDSGAVPLKVEAGELIYKEKESAIVLSPKCRMTRGSMVVDASRGVVWLDQGNLRRVEAFTARGVDQPEPGRQLEYAADLVFIEFGPKGVIEKISGEGNARAVSVEKSARTTVNSKRFELEFDAGSGESQLRRALATGQAVIESAPVPAAGAAPPETRVLRSEAVELIMQAGGREMQSVRTQAAGVIEFLPNHPNQSRRRLEGNPIWIAYGSDNRIRSLDAAGASTRTEPARLAGNSAPPAMLTWSKMLRVDFSPTGSELTQLDQWGEFRYEQGDRRGLAERGVFAAAENRIRLMGAARLWDSTGSLSADQVVMDQTTGDVEAEGNVASTREPEAGSKPTAVLTGSAPLHAKSARMTSTGSRRIFRYEGNAVLWQGGNRIQADTVEIDRGGQTLVARGNVRSQFAEQPAGAGTKAAPLVTVIQARALSYSDKDRTARYTGGVTMRRAGLDVSAAELRGLFSLKDGATVLETAFADGAVRIADPGQGRMRRGTAEHAEYAVAEAKVVLSGGAPEFTDSLRGSTRGRMLTWFADSDRLLVEGRESEPAVSRIRRDRTP
ncbi:MAG TPA: LptA/OstA family protein [Bryobacteraceae bacterium]|nr:LptA/OstA family protein [Bryobacteraceae bacterium]